MSAIRSFKHWVERATRLSPPAAASVGVLLLLACAGLDWVINPQIAMSAVYLVPVSWVTWRLGRWPGLAMAWICGATWVSVELMTNPMLTNPWIGCWNGLIRTIFFSLVSGLQSEVNQRKRAERRLWQANDELREQASVLQSILNNMGDGVVVASAQGVPLHINPAARRILRLPPAETDLLGWFERHESVVADSPPGSAVRSPLVRAVRGEAVDDAEVHLLLEHLPEGVWVLVSDRPMFDATGKVTGGVIVFSDITARRELERRVAHVSDREQRRLGEDLHDGLCQHLVSTAMAARTLAARLSGRSLTEAADAAKIADLLGECIAQARDVARGLYLVPLDAGGLSSALEEFTSQVCARHHVACRFVGNVSVPLTDEALVTNLFRIAQEGVNNAVKHAQARHITVLLAADQQQIRLQVEDDGTGLPANAPAGRGMGFHIMSHRARMLGAALHIGPRSGGGTLLACSLRRNRQENHAKPD